MTINVQTPREYKTPVFMWVCLILLTISTALFAFIAIRNSQPLACDNIKHYEDLTEVCEIRLK